MFSWNMASTMTMAGWLIGPVAILALGGCEHKNATSTNKTKGDGASRPNAKPDTGGSTVGTVRAPVAADLAEYTKDLPGSGDRLFATIETRLGTLECELFAGKAPMTVANFIGLATGKKPWTNPASGEVESGKPYFDGLLFHRVIPKFMIQGGDPTGTGMGGPGYKFGDELSPELDMGPGTLAMANAGPVTNGSQFFVMDQASRPDLASKHTIFGACKDVDVVSKITGAPTGRNDKPSEDITMKVKVHKG